jgi:hypothetical protein
MSQKNDVIAGGTKYENAKRKLSATGWWYKMRECEDNIKKQSKGSQILLPGPLERHLLV